MDNALDYKARVEQQFNQQGFMHHLGALLTVHSPGEVSIEVPFSEKLAQQHGFFHGGVIATLADNASGFAGYSLMEKDEQPLTLEFKINFINKALGDKIVCKAEVIKKGNRIKVCKAEVICFQNEKETVCATALASIMTTTIKK